MALYSCSAPTIYAGTTPIVSAEVRTTSSQRCRLLEWSMTNYTTNSGAVQIVRPSARGVTPSTEVTVIPEYSYGPAGRTTLATAWSTRPTVPSYAGRAPGHGFFIHYLPASIGWRLLYEAPRGLVIPESSSLVLYEIQLTNVLILHILVDE